MKLIRTVPIKLSVTEDISSILLRMISSYTTVYNTICQFGFNNKITNGITLHKYTYQNSRSLLPSQLAISARMLAAESLKSVFSLKKKQKQKISCPNSKRMSIRLDKNSYTLFLDKQIVSILTCDGRIKIPIKLNRYFNLYNDWKYTSATLKFKKNKFFLNIVFEKDMTDIPTNNKFVGIDRGINNIAVTSNNKFYSGKKIKQICKRYAKLRAKLQKCNSKSAKRHLCRLSGKEQRFKADVNHCISKQIISELDPGTTIVLENLVGIRNKRMRKKTRTKVNSWNYYQLEQFLIYKGAEKGINIEYVDARYTSQRCSNCGHIKRSNRKSHDFRCKKCNFNLNADLNAARNIVLKYLGAREKSTMGDFSRSLDGADVNQPIVSVEIKSSNDDLIS